MHLKRRSKRSSSSSSTCNAPSPASNKTSFRTQPQLVVLQIKLVLFRASLSPLRLPSPRRRLSSPFETAFQTQSSRRCFVKSTSANRDLYSSITRPAWGHAPGVSRETIVNSVNDLHQKKAIRDGWPRQIYLPSFAKKSLKTLSLSSLSSFLALLCVFEFLILFSSLVN